MLIYKFMEDKGNGYGELAKLRKISRENKRIKNRKLFDKYDFTIVKEYNNIVEFIHDDTTFYLTELTGLVREKGSKINHKLRDFVKGEY